jgi:uncharacterized membrane protein YccC
VSLTVLNVLIPDWVTTASRGIDRWIGTILGVLAIGAFATAAHLSGTLLVVTVTVVIWAAFTVEPVNYGLFSRFLSGYVVLLLQVLQAAPLSSAAFRAIDTTIGGALALTANALVRRRDVRPPE